MKEEHGASELAEEGQINEKASFPRGNDDKYAGEIDGISRHELEHHEIYELPCDFRRNSLP